MATDQRLIIRGHPRHPWQYLFDSASASRGMKAEDMSESRFVSGGPNHHPADYVIHAIM
jgi:hypothetical protein